MLSTPRLHTPKSPRSQTTAGPPALQRPPRHRNARISNPHEITCEGLQYRTTAYNNRSIFQTSQEIQSSYLSGNIPAIPVYSYSVTHSRSQPKDIKESVTTPCIRPSDITAMGDSQSRPARWEWRSAKWFILATVALALFIGSSHSLYLWIKPLTT
jgi:hypothetical protein